MEGCKCLILDFENDGLLIKVIALYLDEKLSIQTKNRVVALSMMASIVFISLVWQV